MKVNVVSPKMIKPCKPTPPHLRTYNISLLDQLMPPTSLLRIFYYNPSCDSVELENHMCLLEESLGRVLPLFYPLAGRYNKEKLAVDCNDEGAEYSIAQVLDCQLDDFVNKPEHLNDLLPFEAGWTDEPTEPMMAVQINRFKCGGLAIGVCFSHRIIDSYSMSIFLKAWANHMNDANTTSISPDFDSPRYFPSENIPQLLNQPEFPKTKNIAMRFIFDKHAIRRLKEWVMMVNKEEERPPSRVSVVSAFLAQAFMRADRAKKHDGKSSTTIIRQVVDIRHRTVPPLSEYAMGMWVLVSMLECSPVESLALENDFPGLVSKMRAANIKSIEDCSRILSDREFGRWITVLHELEIPQQTDDSSHLKVIYVSDLTKFGDYQLDFGFGTPIWVSLADTPFDDFIVLMNTKENDGIEAWLYLHDSDITYFEQDHHLKMFSSPINL